MTRKKIYRPLQRNIVMLNFIQGGVLVNMDENLISKKELLELTGISYGQLYRWKRKNLIPEDWFIRRSTFTGQETFFPKDKILARIDRIINMKDDLSLDQLADMFSPNPAEASLSIEELMKRNIVSQTALNLYLDQYGERNIFAFAELLSLYVLEKLLQTGEISLEEGKNLIQVMEENYKKFAGKECELLLIRKMGISIFLLLSSAADLFLETRAKVVVRMNLANMIEELKIILS